MPGTPGNGPESSQFVRERVWEYLDEENQSVHQEWVSWATYVSDTLYYSWCVDFLIKAHHNGALNFQRITCLRAYFWYSLSRLLCEVSNIKTGLTAQGKHLQFSRVAFGFHGNWFVAGDHHGNIYHFDLTKNRSVNRIQYIHTNIQHPGDSTV